MMQKKRSVFLFTIILSLLILLPSCDGKTNNKGMDSTREIVVNLGTEPPQLNSILTTDAVSMNVLRATMEGLTRLDQNSRPIPGIAEKWDISPDGLTYTFYLRDAKWSDGSPVTAKDFEFAWKSVLNSENAAEYAYQLYVIKGAAEYNEGTGKVEDVGIRVIDEKTLEVTLETLTPHFLDLCAFGVFLPVKQDFYEKQAEGDSNLYGTEADRLIYNGPWMITSWAHEDRIVLEKNPYYYNRDNIKLDKIIMLMVKDANTAYNMFAAGELDMVVLQGGEQMEKAKNDGYTPLGWSEGTTVYLEYNMNNSVLANVNIRKALTYAIDRETHISKVLKNNSIPALSFTSPAIRGYKESFQKEVGNLFKDNNREEAKKLLETGMKELGIASFPRLTVIADDSSTGKNELAAYQELWKKTLGIDVDVQNMPFNVLIDRLAEKDFEIALSLWGPDYNDPMTFLSIWETDHPYNDVSYSSKEYDELLSKIREEKDEKNRYSLLVQAEKKLMEDMPIGPVYFRTRSYVVKPYLKGVVRNAFQDMDLYWAYVDISQRK